MAGVLVKFNDFFVFLLNIFNDLLKIRFQNYDV